MAVMSPPSTIEWVLDEDATEAPRRAYRGDAGFDMFSSRKAQLIEPGRTIRIETGIRVACPEGWWLEVMDRSSMALRGYHVIGGVVDEGYTGRIGVILYNSTREPFVVTPGMKVAQAVFQRRYIDGDERHLEVRGELKHGSSGQ